MIEQLLSEYTLYLKDNALVEVNRKLRDKSDRTLKLVDWSLLANVPDDLISKTLAWATEASNPAADRSVGALVGLAVADWVGASLEFLEVSDVPTSSRWDHEAFAYQNPNTHEIERGILKPGQWTDDTSMALCLADSLILKQQFDGSDLRKRFWCWYAEGLNNTFRFDQERPKRLSFGLGYNIAKSLMALVPEQPIDPEYVNPGSSDSGNGALMRLAPVPIFYSSPQSLDLAIESAALSSLTTHPGFLATETAKFLAFLIHLGINRPEAGKPCSAREFLEVCCTDYITRIDDRLASAAERSNTRDECEALQQLRSLLASDKEDDSTERCWNWKAESLELRKTFNARGEKYNGHPVSRSYAGSYCMDGLAMAMYSVAATTSFHAAVERAVNFLGDADSVGAIAGQIAGSFYGYSGIDERYVAALKTWDRGEIGCRGALCFIIGRAKAAAM